MSESPFQSKTYGGFRPEHPLYRVMRQPLLALAVYWIFQGILYMDPTERRFKLALDMSLTAILAWLLHLWTDWPAALVLAWLIAHTMNFFFNGHLWGALKHFGYVRTTQSSFIHYQDCLTKRVLSEPSILYAAVYGSLARDRWNSSSDMDIRLLRARGLRMACRALLFAMVERSRALFAHFPLDLYVLDDWDGFDRQKLLEHGEELKRSDSQIGLNTASKQS